MTTAKRTLVAALAAAFMASGCQTYDPYTGESKVSKTVWGTLIGAAGGAAIGALTGGDSRERRQRALLGAGIGGLAGGAVGYYMDEQERKLRERLAATGVQVVRSGDEIHLVMPGHITFEVDRADIKADFFEVLGSVALVVNEYDKTIIDVLGHTDSTGSDAHNQTLSEQRAASVSAYLQAQGVAPGRLATRGFGEQYPVASNDNAEGRRINRRVEIKLVPLTT